MKSGLEDRNNLDVVSLSAPIMHCLNEVRPGRPEQSNKLAIKRIKLLIVSMKSGLEDRNNSRIETWFSSWTLSVSMKSGLEDRNNKNFRSGSP